MSSAQTVRRTRMVFVCGPDSATDQAREDAWNIYSHITDLSCRHKKEAFSSISMIQCGKDVPDYRVTDLLRSICSNPEENCVESVVAFAHEEGAHLVKKGLRQETLVGYFRRRVPDGDIDKLIEDLRENLAVFSIDGAVIIGKDVAKTAMNVLLETSATQETGKVQEKTDQDGVPYLEVRFHKENQEEQEKEDEPKQTSSWKDGLLASVQKSSESIAAVATYLSETITAKDLLDFIVLIMKQSQERKKEKDQKEKRQEEKGKGKTEK